MIPHSNPSGKFRCVACGLIWDGSKLRRYPLSIRDHWTCGDATCGSNVVKIDPPDPIEEETETDIVYPEYED